MGAVVRNQKTESVAVRDHAAAYQVHLSDQAVVAAPVANNLPVTFHGAQASGERAEIPFRLDTQCRRQLVCRQRPPARLQGLKHELAAGNRVSVAARLARAVWVLAGSTLGHR